MVSDVTKVKTFQPVLCGEAKGPVCLEPHMALYDILQDVHERANLDIKTPEGVNIAEFEKFVHMINVGLDIKDWINGEYVIFEDYKIIVRTYAQYQLDEMGEFNGY